MKTPDEIKKGLETCVDKSNCSWCPRSYDCERETDALAYIKQLEAKNAELLEKNKQLERERDELAKLYKPHGSCGNCKNYYHKDSTLCDVCTNKNNLWEWRGLE